MTTVSRLTLTLGLTTLFTLACRADAVGAQAVTAPPPPPVESGPLQMNIQLDRTAIMQGGDGIVRLEVALKATAGSGKPTRLPTDLVVVLDKSGSMDGDKIRFAREATRALIAELAPHDRFGLVTYDDDARVLIPLREGAGKDPSLPSRILGIPADGSTNMSGGLELAAEVLGNHRAPGRAARVVLISDGLPNRGDATREGLIARARKVVAHEAVLTTVGVGMDWDESLMATLADAGTGNLHFLQNGTSLAEVFAHELDSAGSTVASGVRVRMHLAAGIELISAGGYPTEQRGSESSFAMGPVSAGHERRVWLTLKVPVDQAGNHRLGDVGIDWTDVSGGSHALAAPVAAVDCVADEAKAWASVDKGAWEKATVEERWGEVQTTIGEAMKTGDKKKAKDTLATYRQDIGAANTRVQSAAVSTNLEEAAALDAEIDDAFVGPDQAQKQGVMNKAQSTSGYGKRRGKEAVVKQ